MRRAHNSAPSGSGVGAPYRTLTASRRIAAVLNSVDHLREPIHAGGETSGLSACATLLARCARDVVTAAQAEREVPADAREAATAIARALSELGSAVSVMSERLPASAIDSREANISSQALLVALHDASHYAELLAQHLPGSEK